MEAKKPKGVPKRSEKLRKRAEKILNTRATEIPVMPTKEVQELVHELNVHQIELELQNENLRQTQMESAHTRDRYLDLYEVAPVGYVTLNNDGEILEANLTLARMLDVDRGDMLNSRLTKFVSRESQDDFYLFHREAFSNLGKHTADFDMKRGDGTRLTSHVESVTFESEGQKLCRMGLIDITLQKEAEFALQELNIHLDQSLTDRTKLLQQSVEQIALLSNAMANLGEGVLITDDDLDWPEPRIVFVNEALCQITGYTRDDLIGTSPRILERDNTDGKELKRIKSELAAGNSVRSELTNFRKNGTPYEVELFITPLVNAAGHRTNFVSIHRDVTLKKQIERRVQRSEQRFRALTNATNDVIFLMSPDWTLMWFLEGRGLMTDTLESNDRWLKQYISPDEQSQVLSAIDEAIRSKSPFELEHQIIKIDGSAGWVHSRAVPILNEHGEIIEWFGAAADITGRKLAEQSSREREELLRAVLNTASDAVINIDHHGIITNVNPAAETMFGYSADELIGQNVNILMPEPHRSHHGEYISHYLKTGERRLIGVGREVFGQRKDGTTFPVSLSVSEVDHLGIFTGVLRDETERKKLQREVAQIADEEQRRIGQELHDSVQQEVTGLGMLARTFANKLKKGMSVTEVELDLAEKITDGISRVHEQLQEVSHGLVPVLFDPSGLSDALNELALRIDALPDIECTFTDQENAELLDKLTATQLYRIAQEATTNALKHGHPNRIEITLESVDGRRVLEVADDGQGFEVTQHSDGIGLRTMTYRANLIGASLTVDSEPSCGTVVTCRVFQGHSK